MSVILRDPLNTSHHVPPLCLAYLCCFRADCDRLPYPDPSPPFRYTECGVYRYASPYQNVLAHTQTQRVTSSGHTRRNTSRSFFVPNSCSGVIHQLRLKHHKSHTSAQHTSLLHLSIRLYQYYQCLFWSWRVLLRTHELLQMQMWNHGLKGQRR